jgi:hypothetical protein
VFFSLQLLSKAFLILRPERDMIKNVKPIGLHAKRPLLLSDFNETIFFPQLFEKLQYEIS